MRSPWSEVCWSSEDGVDYLELEAEYSSGWQVQRQILFAGSDEFFFVADAILGPAKHRIDYRMLWPLAGDVRLDRDEPTWDGMLSSDRPLVMVLPPALPEWQQAANSVLEGSLNFEPEEGGLRLRQVATVRRMYAPLFFDLRPRRAAKQRTWRTLTVAHQLEAEPPEVAVGYRVQSGNAQWLFYRSLGQPANRTVCGLNTNRDFVACRLLPSGMTDSLIEIQ